MSEFAIGNVREFRIPRASEEDTVIIPQISEFAPEPAERVEITPDMETGIAEYAINHTAPYTDRQRAIAISVLRHSFFLPAGRHSRPRS